MVHPFNEVKRAIKSPLVFYGSGYDFLAFTILGGNPHTSPFVPTGVQVEPELDFLFRYFEAI